VSDKNIAFAVQNGTKLVQNCGMVFSEYKNRKWQDNLTDLAVRWAAIAERCAIDVRQLEMNSLSGTQPVKSGESVCDVI
jgi:hypothetical protein